MTECSCDLGWVAPGLTFEHRLSLGEASSEGKAMRGLGSNRLLAGRTTRRHPWWGRVRDVTVALSLALGTLALVPAAPAQAAPPTNELSVNIVSARTEARAFDGAGVSKGDPIPDFKYVINIDNTGNTAVRNPAPGSGCSAQDAGYPDSCDWQSIAEPSGWTPVYDQGNQDDLPLTLPEGRYLISVLADGYKIDGAHFCVSMSGPQAHICDSPLDGPLQITMQPTPLPDATLRASVFEDNAPTNGGLDTGEQNLEGFVGHIVDTLGEIQTDVYGNPLCTRYEGEDWQGIGGQPPTYQIPNGALDPTDMTPIPIPGSGGECLSDANGMLAIPHLGPNRYAVSVTPPDGQNWIQTTTLEGNHDYDFWALEGDTGFDTTFARGGEPTPLPIFGFVKPNATNGVSLDPSAAGRIKGSVVSIKSYTPPIGGSYNFWGGNTGTKVGGPIKRPWISLMDLQAGDLAVWVGRGKADGTFDIPGVPDGNYTLAWWDQPQDYNLNFINVTVAGGQLVKMGQLPLNGWWTEYSGYVFNDANRNGVRDPGENGVPNFTLTIRHRENNLYDRGQNTATTDKNGYYYFESGYPIGEWTVMEAYSDSFYTTGLTYQADNQEDPTTVLGAGVDISSLPIIGLSGTVDWGVHAYDPKGTNGVDPRNGGIVGTVSYDTTRNELDPRYAATEDWQVGISGVDVELHAPVDCPSGQPGGTAAAPCDADGIYQLGADGSYLQGKLLNSYVTESWERPTGCTARDVDGNALIHGVDENVLAVNQEINGPCISSFMQGIQFGPYPTDQGTQDANFGAAVNGNYGFGDGCFNGNLDATDPANPNCVGGTFEALGAGDYLVHVVAPEDVNGDPEFKATGEEDINIGDGDQLVPQVLPPACAGPLHTVDVLDPTNTTDGYPAVVGSADPNDSVPDGVTVPASTPVDNSTFVGIGGSPYEGTTTPTCDTKLVELKNGKSVAPIFNVFSDVPPPARFRTVIIDDLNFSTDPRSIMYGEKAGLAFAPVGIYDFNNDLQYTTETDFNGIYDVLMPSTNTISCPTPSGICANMYRVVANDPGIPGNLNPNYNPRFATHAAGAEGLVGASTFADLAPTQVGVTIETPNTGISQAVTCPVDGATPQLFTVTRPYVDVDGSAGARSFTINGLGFGNAGDVTLDGTSVPTANWTDTSIDVTVPLGADVGPKQLLVTRASNGQSSTNGLTIHALGASYNPTLYEVGPGHPYATIQSALDEAQAVAGDNLVVVYPGEPTPNNPRLNPRGAYFENLVMASPVKLQGVGPGGFQGNTYVPGSIIDASSYSSDNGVAADWLNKVGGLTWDGNQTVNDGEGIYVLASQNGSSSATRAGDFTPDFMASIDGFDIRGGNQNGFPGNVNDLTGANTGLPPNITTQGGAIFANSYAQHLQITNNVVQNNGGGYGTIRIGTPDIPAPDTSSHNENVRIANNRVINNAGTNLAGGVGIFAGADNYEVADNDICGNFSLEYGGGLTVYGKSPDGKIHHNRVTLNYSNDEGGGIMIAGELPAVAGDLSPGSGPVDIYANQIQANLANDDGGGIRFLMAGDYPMNIYNNMIVNNISTHEGGGIGINDAPDVSVYNNTIMKNMTTATALTSDGNPAPAGLSTSGNSDMLQETLASTAPLFSDPKLFNNIFWDNRAGTRSGGGVTGLGIPGDASPVNHWDLGVAQPQLGEELSPTNSILQANNSGHPIGPDGTNSGDDPSVLDDTFYVSVNFATWRQNPGFVDATLVTLDAPPSQMGDYHLSNGSPAVDFGAGAKAGTTAPDADIDGDYRPNGAAVDAGADEIAGGTPPPVCPPDCAPPTVNTVTFDPNPTAGAASVSLTGTAAAGDPADPVTAAEWFTGTDPGNGAGNAVTVSGTGPFDLSAVMNVSTWANGTYPISVRAKGAAGGWGATFTADLVVTHPVVPPSLYFSTRGNGSIPGLSAPFDDAHIYGWNGTSFTLERPSTNGPLAAGANVDGFDRVDATHFYMSFSATTSLPGLANVQDEDVVYFNGTSWALYFDGSAHGMTSSSRDLDAISVDGSTLYFSTLGNSGPPGLAGNPPRDDADIYSWNGTSYARVWDASAHGLLSGANVDGISRVDDTHFYLTFASTLTAVPGMGLVEDEDIVYYNGGTNGWSLFFDGTAAGLTGGSRDLDAIDVP